MCFTYSGHAHLIASASMIKNFLNSQLKFYFVKSGIAEITRVHPGWVGLSPTKGNIVIVLTVYERPDQSAELVTKKLYSSSQFFSPIKKGTYEHSIRAAANVLFTQVRFLKF